MKKKGLKTIDINVKEWFDRVNGNSYFAGEIIINFSLKNEETFILPFQYGYGDQFISETTKRLVEMNYISLENDYDNLWTVCIDNHIILRTFKKENCLKKELKQFTN